MRTSGIIVSLVLSATLTYMMYLFADNFVHIVDRELYAFFDVRFGYWSLQYIVFALVIGTIPLISLIPWVIRGHQSAQSLFAYNIISATFIALFTSAIALWLIVIYPNEGIFNTVKQPHEQFWNYVLVASNLLTVLIFLIFSIKTGKKYRLKNKFSASKTQLDQEIERN